MEELYESYRSQSTRPLSEAAESLITEGRRIAKTVNCFDFVPSNYEQAWKALDALPRGRFCEWGSGLGIVTGLAAMLGFDAYGIEMDVELSRQSQILLDSHRLKASILQGDYIESEVRADIYYVYCWPNLMEATKEHFACIALPHTLLLICYGQDDIRTCTKAFS